MVRLCCAQVSSDYHPSAKGEALKREDAGVRAKALQRAETIQSRSYRRAAAGAAQAAGPGRSLRARWAHVLTAAPLRLCEPARSQPFNPITGAPVMPVSSMMSQAPGRGGGASQGPSSYSGSAMGSVLGGGPASFASRQD